MLSLKKADFFYPYLPAILWCFDQLKTLMLPAYKRQHTKYLEKHVKYLYEFPSDTVMTKFANHGQLNQKV